MECCAAKKGRSQITRGGRNTQTHAPMFSLQCWHLDLTSSVYAFMNYHWDSYTLMRKTSENINYIFNVLRFKNACNTQHVFKTLWESKLHLLQAVPVFINFPRHLTEVRNFLF
ncbi:hypothetical protein GOODEAATRI_013736 [Goodea atripinnis]|uniref:Maturase K n=1 Tax=Goodea atripinnis TaxID=208336 RepID=A0ABV0MHL8_9TELE